MKLTKEQVHKIPGLFHVTTEIAWIQILQDGLKAGIDLPRSRNGGGRADIHMLVVPPYPKDQFKNKRLDKMWNTGYGTVVVISNRKEALDLDDARINQQGVVLQRTPIPPSQIDYAIRIHMTESSVTCTYL